MPEDFTEVHEQGDSDSERKNIFYIYSFEEDQQLADEIISSVENLGDNLIDSKKSAIEYYRILRWTHSDYDKLQSHPAYDGTEWDETMFLDWLSDQYDHLFNGDESLTGHHLAVRENSPYLKFNNI